RRLPGGSALASITGSGLFAAVTGSSVATVATMARVSTDAIKRAGHSIKLAAGVVSAGGTLGVLIPPSIVLVLYGVVTSENIGQIILDALGPGLLTILAYSITAMTIVTIENRKNSPLVEQYGYEEADSDTATVVDQLKPMLDIIGVVYLAIIFFVSIGTI